VTTVADTECSSRVGAKPAVSCYSGGCPTTAPPAGPGISISKTEFSSADCQSSSARIAMTITNGGSAAQGAMMNPPNTGSSCPASPPSWATIGSDWTQNPTGTYNTTMNYSGLPTGLYCVYVRSTDGQSTAATSFNLTNPTGDPSRCQACPAATPFRLGGSCVQCNPSGSPQSCTPAAPGATGQQTCDASGQWGSCYPITCQPGYAPQGSAPNITCVAQAINPSGFMCERWDENPIIIDNLWKSVGNLDYYYGYTHNNGGDALSCLGIWDRTQGVWTATRRCKYSNARECDVSSVGNLTPYPSRALAPPFPACPDGGTYGSNGCNSLCGGSSFSCQYGAGANNQSN